MPDNADTLSYRLDETRPLPHDPISSIVGPRPIGWISTRNAAGQANLAPYSFFTVINYQPPIVMFSSVGKKDSTTNAEDIKEFVVNLATRPLAEAVNASSIALPYGESEFEHCGLHEAPCLMVGAPRVAESPVALECKVTQVQQLADQQGNKLETWVTYGEVVAVHIAKRLLDEGIFQTDKAGIILRAGGPADYFEVLPEGKFEMFRPR